MLKNFYPEIQEETLIETLIANKNDVNDAAADPGLLLIQEQIVKEKEEKEAVNIIHYIHFL